MIEPAAFQQSLINLLMSVDDFSRVSGIALPTIRKYCKQGVPDKQTDTVIELLSSARRKLDEAVVIDGGDQMDIEDY